MVDAFRRRVAHDGVTFFICTSSSSLHAGCSLLSARFERHRRNEDAGRKGQKPDRKMLDPFPEFHGGADFGFSGRPCTDSVVSGAYTSRVSHQRPDRTGPHCRPTTGFQVRHARLGVFAISLVPKWIAPVGQVFTQMQPAPADIHAVNARRHLRGRGCLPGSAVTSNGQPRTVTAADALLRSSRCPVY